MVFIIKKDFIPTRAVLWVLCFTCTCFLYMIRINLSIIILAMTEPSKDSNKTFIPECTRLKMDYINSSDGMEHHDGTPDYGVRYNWDNKLQGLILGAYFWGFTLTGIPGGALAERFSPSKCVTISFIVSGLLTLVGPLVASVSASLLIATRFFIGAFGGIVFPSLHCLIARWVPPDEKGKFVGALLGGALGTIITWPMLGAIIEGIGWTWSFYICGIIVLGWTALWMYCVSDSPEVHPRISDDEKNYILNSLAGKVTSNVKRLPPYKDMALSLPFLALVILHFGNLWGLFFLMTAGPNFMSSVLGFNLGHTGILAALPYLARLIFGWIFGQLGDLILKKTGWKRLQSGRASYCSVTHVLPGLLLFSQTLTACDVNWAIVLITMSLGMNGASTLTNLQNSQDLAPNFAGTLYGIINCIGSTTGFISPLVVGYLTAERNGLDEWHIIFYIGSSVYIGCGILFCIFGSGEIQPWNYSKPVADKEIDGIENIAFDGVNYSKEETIEK